MATKVFRKLLWLPVLLIALLLASVAMPAYQTIRVRLAKDDWDEFYGLERIGDGPEYILRPPTSKVGLTEKGLDLDDDGQLDYWEVEAGEADDQWRILFHIEDADGDGEKDLYGAAMGPEDQNTWYELRDDDGDAVADRVEFSMGSFSNPDEWVIYQDYDMDSVVDKITRFKDRKKSDVMIIDSYELYHVVEERGEQEPFEVKVERGEGEAVWLVYKGGWQEKDDTPADGQ